MRLTFKTLLLSILSLSVLCSCGLQSSPPETLPVEIPQVTVSSPPPVSTLPPPSASPVISPEPEPSPSMEPPQETVSPTPSASPEPSLPPVEPVTPEPEPEPPAAPANTTLYILMYHHLVEDGAECNAWTIPVSRFREDLQWIHENGYVTVLPREIAAGMPLPEKAVMITFDDGYTSNYELAYPLLQEFQAKAVISLVTKYIGEQAYAFMSWDMAREMDSSGLVEFGSHTHSLHNNGIIRLDGEDFDTYCSRVFPDIQQSIDLIQSQLGTPPVFFAYPHGRTDSWASDFLREHFSMTVTTAFGPVDLSNGCYLLSRHNVTTDVKASHFLK